MNDAERLRRRLEKLVEKTITAEGLRPAAWWEGDRAGERRVYDDVKSGRLAWMQALRDARWGLDALAAGDLDMAQMRAWSATDLYIEALEKSIRPQELAELGKSAKPRGRPPKKPIPNK